ncbi:MAG TPA: acyl-CoA dehydrogenase family protein [Kofleriaceae bacterium]|nr:acyl-CoA dehydrogenase family protein [Kofleriaceae bacterium]
MDTWQRCSPLSGGLGPLEGIGSHLSRIDTQAELARCEATELFPEQLIAQLRQLGLPLVFAPGAPYATAYHMNTLSALAAQHSGSLAISIGITGLALLPVYIAGTGAQLALVRERVLAGAQAAMLLSEWSHGSDLLATETRAERGRCDGGGFSASAGPAEHYRVSGEKQLINLGRRAQLLTTLARTSQPAGGLGGAGGLTLLLIERDRTVEALPRRRTLAAPAAEIGGARFAGTLVPASSRIGEEGEGFRLVQSALALSRGGISAFAAGTATRACRLAFAHARERVLYGEPIARLPAVADHLARMAAFDLAANCLSLAAAAAVNALGQRAAHLTAVAKLVSCDLAERAVVEGRAVLSARALLADLPYQQVLRDVMLYGIFDGTRHLMLDQIQWRVRQMVRLGETDEERPAIYAAPPAPMTESARRRGRAWLPRPAGTAARLAGMDGIDLGPLADAARALESATARLAPEAWSEPLAFTVAASWARLEAALAVAELGDPARRAALGLPAMPEAPLEIELAGFAIALVALEALADARIALAGCGVELGAEAAERALALEQARAGRALRAALREWGRGEPRPWRSDP